MQLMPSGAFQVGLPFGWFYDVSCIDINIINKLQKHPLGDAGMDGVYICVFALGGS